MMRTELPNFWSGPVCETGIFAGRMVKIASFPANQWRHAGDFVLLRPFESGMEAEYIV